MSRSRSRSRGEEAPAPTASPTAVPTVVPTVVPTAAPTDAPPEQSPFVCVIFGGPGSGKTMLGRSLQRQAFPGLCHASCGDIARLVSSEEARKSPLLGSIGKQLSDRRRRKAAHRRLLDVVTAVLAEGLLGSPRFAGLVVDGLRASDLEGFEKAVGCRAACLLQLSCPREVMLSRLQGRCGRDGDEHLGVRDTTDDAGRIDAYLHRERAETELLQAYAPGTVHALDAAAPATELAASATAALRVAGGDALRRAEGTSPAPEPINWAQQLAATAVRLDAELHPDGRPRAKPKEQ